MDADDEFVWFLVLSKLNFTDKWRLRRVNKRWNFIVTRFFLPFHYFTGDGGKLNFISSSESVKANCLTLEVNDNFTVNGSTIPFGFQPKINGLKSIDQQSYVLPKNVAIFFNSFMNQFGSRITDVKFSLLKISPKECEDYYRNSSEFYLLPIKPVIYTEMLKIMSKNSPNLKSLSLSQVYFRDSISFLADLLALETLCLHSCDHSFGQLLIDMENLLDMIGFLKYFGVSRLPYCIFEYLGTRQFSSPLNLFYQVTSSDLKYDVDARRTTHILENCRNFSVFLHLYVQRLETTNYKFVKIVQKISTSLVWLEIHCRTLKPPVGLIDSLMNASNNLQSLKISGCRYLLTDGDVCAISRWLKNLRTLHLGRNVSNGVDDFLPLKQLRFIKDFLLYGAFSMRNTVLYQLAWCWCDTLESLHLERCKRLTAYGLFRCLCVSNVLKSVQILVAHSGQVEHLAQLTWCTPLSLQFVRFTPRHRDLPVDDDVRANVQSNFFGVCTWTKDEFVLTKKCDLNYNGNNQYFPKSSIQTFNQCPFCNEYVIVE